MTLRGGRITLWAAPFIPGLELARHLHAEVVAPLLQEITPGLRYSAALLGPGSEVLGLHTERSTDHDWGPRLQVFLLAGTASRDKNQISRALAGRLPAGFARLPSPVPAHRRATQRRPAPTSPWRYWSGRVCLLLGFDPQRGISLLDWLATPAQRLAEFTGGAVFHDGLGARGSLRDRPAWYPDDLWRYLLACQWRRIAQEAGIRRAVRGGWRRACGGRRSSWPGWAGT